MRRAGLCDMICWERSSWFSTPGWFFACLCFFVGMTFHTKTKIKHTLDVCYCSRYSIPPPPNPPWDHLLSMLNRGCRWLSRPIRKSGWGYNSDYSSEHQVYAGFVFLCERSFQQKNTNKRKSPRALRTKNSSLRESYHTSPRDPPSLEVQLQSHLSKN